jgi:hypothetical protein
MSSLLGQEDNLFSMLKMKLLHKEVLLCIHPACSLKADWMERDTEERGPDRRLVFQAAFLLINLVP